MAKNASILDYPREDLDKSIWDTSADEIHLQPGIHDEIEDIVRSFLDDLDLPQNALLDVFIYGSILTNQYNRETDIDARILLDPKVVKKLYPRMTGDDLYNLMIESIHGIDLGGTNHPLNATIVIQDEKTLLGEAPLGITDRDPVYSLKDDRIIHEGIQHDETFDPDKEFVTERDEVTTTMQQLDKLIQDAKTNTIDYALIKEAVSEVKNPQELIAKLEEKLESIQIALQKIVEEYERLRDERSESYKNAPVEDRHMAPGNVQYKLLEKYKYMDLLKKLKRIFEAEGSEVSDVAEALQIKAFPYEQKAPPSIEEARPVSIKDDFVRDYSTSPNNIEEGGGSFMHGGSSQCPHCGHTNTMNAAEDNASEVKCAGCGKKYAAEDTADWTSFTLNTSPSIEPHTSPYESDVKIYHAQTMDQTEVEQIIKTLTDIGVSTDSIQKFKDKVKAPVSQTSPKAPDAPTTESALSSPENPQPPPTTIGSPETPTETMPYTNVQGTPVEDKALMQNEPLLPGKALKLLSREDFIINAIIGDEYKYVKHDMYAALLPETTNHAAGKVRVTWYNSKLPIGHTTCQKVTEAADKIFESFNGNVTPAKGSMDKFVLSTNWITALRRLCGSNWMDSSSETVEDAHLKSAIALFGGVQMNTASLFDDGTPGKNPGDDPYSSGGKSMAEQGKEDKKSKFDKTDDDPDEDLIMEVVTILDGVDILPFLNDSELIEELLESLPVLGNPNPKIDQLIAKMSPVYIRDAQFTPAESIVFSSYPYIERNDVAALVNELYSGGQMRGSYRIFNDQISFNVKKDADLVAQELGKIMPSEQIPVEIEAPYQFAPAMAHTKTSLVTEPAEGTGQYSPASQDRADYDFANTSEQTDVVEQWKIDHPDFNDFDVLNLADTLGIDPRNWPAIENLMNQLHQVNASKKKYTDVDEDDEVVEESTEEDTDEETDSDKSKKQKTVIKEITGDFAKELGERIGINWDEVEFEPEDLAKGFAVELEHGAVNGKTNVTNDSIEETAKIAWAHLKEMADYYEKLEKMEKDAANFLKNGRVYMTLCPTCKTIQKADYWQDSPCPFCNGRIPGYFWKNKDEEMKYGGPKEEVPEELKVKFEQEFGPNEPKEQYNKEKPRMSAQSKNNLDSKTRQTINEELSSAGLDGNGRFAEPGEALAKAWTVLDKYNIVPGEVVDAFPFSKDEGRRTIQLEFKGNTGDSFTPGPQIANSMLAMTWYKTQNGNYECLAYLS